MIRMPSGELIEVSVVDPRPAEPKRAYEEAGLVRDNPPSQADSKGSDPIPPMCPVLFTAAFAGNVDMLKEKASQIPTRFTRTGNSVLHIASDFDNLHCVREILAISPELLHKVNDKRETPVHIAAKRGHSKIIEKLLEAAADLNPPDIESGAEPVSVRELLRMTDKKGSAALHEAARHGHLRAVDILVGWDPDFTYGCNAAGETPLYLAAERRHEPPAISILHKCSSPSYDGPFGRTVLHAAVISNLEGLTREIMKTKPDLAKKMDDDNWSPLHWAAFYDRPVLVEQLLSYDESLAYIHDKNGLIPLHVAAGRGHLSSLNAIINKCPDCYDILDMKGRNAIHHASIHNQLGIVRELARIQLFSRLLNDGDEKGNTPLHLHGADGPSPPLVKGDPVPIELRMIRGLDFFAVNDEGLTFSQAGISKDSFRFFTVAKEENVYGIVMDGARNPRSRKPLTI